MKSSSRFHVLAGALAIGTVTTIVAPASATTDTTKPALSMAKYAQFVIGSQINSFPEGDGATESEVTVRFTWKATDASAICDTFLWQEYGSGEDGLASYSDPTLHSWSDLVNSNNDVGKGWQLRGWWVEVRDCAGNETDRWVQGGMPSFTQDSGQVSDIYDGTTISYSVNNWAVSNCTCWSDGTTHKTSTAGASATITKSVDDTGERLALVMEKAPDRGKFKVLVDGVYKTTVDTYAATKRHRTVVWQTAFSTKGTHTVKVVNLATTGRPRIDLDAVITQMPRGHGVPPGCAENSLTC